MNICLRQQWRTPSKTSKTSNILAKNHSKYNSKEEEEIPKDRKNTHLAVKLMKTCWRIYYYPHQIQTIKLARSSFRDKKIQRTRDNIVSAQISMTNGQARQRVVEMTYQEIRWSRSNPNLRRECWTQTSCNPTSSSSRSQQAKRLLTASLVMEAYSKWWKSTNLLGQGRLEWQKRISLPRNVIP